MARWDRLQTRKLIEARLGQEQADLARNCLRAAPERLTHARYHFQEVKRLLAEAIDSKLATTPIHHFMFPKSPEEQGEQQYCYMRAEANLIACAQAIHSSMESLANIVYYAFDLNRRQPVLLPSRVTAKRIASRLRELDGQYTAALVPLQDLLADPSFSAIEAFVNVAKHRGFAETRINIDPPENIGSYFFEFGAFEYSGVRYAEREIEAALAPAYFVASHTLVEVGNAINRLLA